MAKENNSSEKIKGKTSSSPEGKNVNVTHVSDDSPLPSSANKEKTGDQHPVNSSIAPIKLNSSSSQNSKNTAQQVPKKITGKSEKEPSDEVTKEEKQKTQPADTTDAVEFFKRDGSNKLDLDHGLARASIPQKKTGIGAITGKARNKQKGVTDNRTVDLTTIKDSSQLKKSTNKQERKGSGVNIPEADASKGLRGKVVNKETVDIAEFEKMKKDIIIAANGLLKLAGSSVEKLTNEALQKQKKANLSIQRLKDAEVDYAQNDVAQVRLDQKSFNKNKTKKIENLTDSKKEDSLTFSTYGKSDAVYEDPFAVQESDNVHPTLTPSVDPLNLRKEEISSYSSSDKVKRGFFHYFGITALIIGILSLIGYGASFLLALFSESGTEPVAVETVEEPIREVTEVTRITPLDRNSTDISEAKSALTNYFSAESKRLAYSFVLPSSKVSKLFNTYWKKDDPIKVEDLEFQKGYKLPNNSTWVSLKLKDSQTPRHLAMLKVDGGTFKLDWQAYQEIEQVPLKEVIDTPGTNPTRIRAWITPEQFYTGNYSNKFWQNYAAYDMEGNKLNCYLPNNSGNAHEIYQRILQKPLSHPKANKKAKGIYAKLIVRKPLVGASYVEVLDVIAVTWFPMLEDE